MDRNLIPDSCLIQGDNCKDLRMIFQNPKVLFGILSMGSCIKKFNCCFMNWWMLIDGYMIKNSMNHVFFNS